MTPAPPPAEPLARFDTVQPGRIRSPRRRWRIVAVLAVLCVTGAAGAAAWWWLRPQHTGLGAGWTAIVTVLAGNGVPRWRDGDIAAARFSEPFDVAVGADGTLFVSDGDGAHRVRAISPDGRVFTLAGGEPGFIDGVGSDARFNMPSGLSIERSGNLYVADAGNHAIRRVTPDGRVSTVAGDDGAGYQDGPGRHARFNGPLDVAVAPDGRVIVADTYNDRIRAIGFDGTVTTVAGHGAPGFADGPAPDALFDTPAGVAVDPSGAILVADTGNNAVRRIDPAGMVSTLDTSVAAGLQRPIGIAAGLAGEVYVSDERGRVFELRPSGEYRVLAGSTPGFADGTGTVARFRRPSGLVLTSEGRTVVADTGNALVRLVAAPERLELRVPPSPFIAPRFDAARFADWPLLWPVPPMDGPHEVAGTLGEARGGEGSERFHAGVDIRVEHGTPVLAVRDGTVVSPVAAGDLGTLNEWIRIGDLAYVHVRAGRNRQDEILDPARFLASYDDSGKIVRIRVRRGTRFRTGEMIASANRFNHVHLNVGWPGEEHNALRFRLTQFADAVPPTIRRGGVRLFDESGQPLTTRVRGRLVVSGRVQVVVDAWDQADGNRPNRRLGLYAIGYGVLNADGSPAPGFEEAKPSIRFDQLMPGADAARLVYAPGSGIPFYGRRVTRFLYIATNIFRDGIAMADYWDTSLLPPGDYILRVYATDAAGNAAMANRDVRVTIVQ